MLESRGLFWMGFTLKGSFWEREDQDWWLSDELTSHSVTRDLFMFQNHKTTMFTPFNSFMKGNPAGCTAKADLQGLSHIFSNDTDKKLRTSPL